VVVDRKPSKRLLFEQLLKMKFNTFKYGKSKSKEEVQLLNKQAI
jgi:hypothetical protein